MSEELNNEQIIKLKLKNWVVGKSKNIESVDQISDDTPILEQRLITSLQVMDLILFIQSMSATAVQIENLKPGVFKDINTIYTNFFSETN